MKAAKQLLLTTLLSTNLLATQPDASKYHIPFLVKNRKYETAINCYQQYKEQLGHHDYELLEQMATAALQQGASSRKTEVQLISLMATAALGMNTSVELMNHGITSNNPQIQLATVRLLSQLQDDLCDELLSKAMTSRFLPIRMEAGYQLANRKHRLSTGHIEALMHRLPPQFHVYFPEFFALIGTPDAIIILKKLLQDPQLEVRIEAILCATRFRRDDLLPQIRRFVTQTNHAEQEASCKALGFLQDSSSLSSLELLAKSSNPSVQLAACSALIELGATHYIEGIVKLAKQHNLFATTLLGNYPGHENLLFDLSKEKEFDLKLNATIALLMRKDSRCLPTLYELLVHDASDLALYPIYSHGKSLTCWKSAPSAAALQKNSPYDLQGMTLSVREHLLALCKELKESSFLQVAETIFDTKQLQLVPQTVALLEQLGSEKAIALLKKESARAGVPLIRNYSTLALFRLKEKGEYRSYLTQWVRENKGKELFHFRPLTARNPLVPATHFDLTPEENSRLVLEIYTALANSHDEKTLDLLLEVFKEGSEVNRCILAGVLLQTLQ